ncbi:class I SAM-dependent methyltransferase [Methylopila musalis]|uniref:Class I SAM-dependent methyltransferase n=1 Tax=Methylopila musalis TaxID=1134781 RepID=A0ABW3Z9D1_9HYPH
MVTRPTTTRGSARAPLPPCPLTGRPARRAIHGVSAGVVADIWRFAQGVDVSALFQGVDRFTLYESDTGLVFFEPRIVGDGLFYRDFYARWDIHRGLTYRSDDRQDFAAAARFVPDGATVIDVGCGPGAFRRHLGHARFVGLDPYASDDVDDAVIRETLEHHAEHNPERYDVATAFHVIEHVPDPLAHARNMARMLKPGGLLILAAPLHPSPLTEIPNLPMNMPPHHVTWWTPGAFRALAEAAGLEVVEATSLPVSPHQGPVLWMRKFLAVRTDTAPNERYVAHRWSWHASLALAYVLGRIMHRIKTLPAQSEDVDAFLVARKPQA